MSNIYTRNPEKYILSDRLQELIQRDNLILSVIEYIVYEDDTDLLTLSFSASLSAGEEVQLDLIILNLDSTPLPDGVLSPPIISGINNDYYPYYLSEASVLKLSSSADSDEITGIKNDFDGTVFTLINEGSFNIVIKTNSLSSLFENRILLSGNMDLTLLPNEVIKIQYFLSDQKYRII